MDLDPQIVELGARAAEATARNTASSLAARIRTVKARRQDAETIAELEQMVNELISDKNDLVQVTRAYEEQFVAQQVSQDEIDYITTNIVPVIKKLMEAGQSTTDGKGEDDSIEMLGSLLSVQTITVLQLLGFNFRRAIGEPLTNLLAGFIASKAPIDPNALLEIAKVEHQRDIEQMRLAKDAQAVNRYRKLMSDDE